MTNPKPHTLPVLTEKHVDFLRGLVLQLSDQFPAFQPFSEIEAVVLALVSGTHELQERVSGDTVRVPWREIIAVSDALGRHDDEALENAQEHFHRWLTTEKLRSISPETGEIE